MSSDCSLAYILQYPKNLLSQIGELPGYISDRAGVGSGLVGDHMPSRATGFNYWFVVVFKGVICAGFGIVSLGYASLLVLTDALKDSSKKD